MKRLPTLIFIGATLCICMVVLLNGSAVPIEKRNNPVQSLLEGTDRYTASALRKNPNLEQVAKDFTYLSGNIRRNGIYITNNYLLVDHKNNNEARTNTNIGNLKQWLETIDQPCYFALIPTSTAIKQQELPTQIDDLFNERNFISETYSTMSDTASTIDLYSALFSAKDQYTYYRNDTGLTALGGYYVYEAIINRLGYTPMAINQFQIEHLPKSYHGKLAASAEYYSLPGDTISFYYPNENPKYYSITHHNSDGSMKRYYTLFPKHLASLSNPQSVMLGGYSDQIEINSTIRYQESCLVVGDYTAISYLPFMLNHYGRITFLSATASDTIRNTIDYDAYDRVVFILSVDTLLNQEIPPVANAQ